MIAFNDSDVEEVVGDYARSLVRKVLTKKPINRNTLHMAVGNIWCNSKGFRVEEIRKNLF